MRGTSKRALLPVAVALVALAAGAVALASTTAANKRAAQRQAPRLLRLLKLPAGAVAVSGDPSTGRLLSTAPFRPATANVVDVHRFWVVPGDPQSVLAWFDGHPPGRSQANMRGASASSHGFATAWSGFWFGPATSSLSDRELVVTVARARGGGTALRADSQVVWVTARPSWERVPSGARVVTISSRRLGRSPSSPLTVTASTATQIVRLVDALPAAQPGAVACPNDAGPLVSLVFRHARTGPALATVVADGSGCGDVSIRVGHRQGPPLTGGPGLIKQLQLLLHAGLGLA